MRRYQWVSSRWAAPVWLLWPYRLLLGRPSQPSARRWAPLVGRHRRRRQRAASPWARRRCRWPYRRRRRRPPADTRRNWPSCPRFRPSEQQSSSTSTETRQTNLKQQNGMEPSGNSKNNIKHEITSGDSNCLNNTSKSNSNTNRKSIRENAFWLENFEWQQWIDTDDVLRWTRSAKTQ